MHIHSRAATVRVRSAARCLAVARLSWLVAATSVLSACAPAAGVSSANEDSELVGIVVKTFDNPYFAALTEGAEQEGAALGVRVKAYAGETDGDTAAQIAAIEELVALGAKGILITPSGSEVLPALAEAREAGLLVIALDSPTDPADAVDATFATDNFGAGFSIGQWARGTVDPAAARIAMLDLNDEHIPVDVSRDQGFLSGFGIDVKDAGVIGDEEDARIVGHRYTGGSVEGGREAMTELMSAHPDINLVYTINEPAAAGAYEVLVEVGREDDVVLVSIDGGCAGVDDVATGAIGATAMQFPLRMARLGLDAVIDYALTGDVPPASPGLQFFDTGSQLVTGTPVDGLYTKDAAWGAQHCWG